MALLPGVQQSACSAAATAAALHSVDLTPTGDSTKDKRAIYEAMIEAMDTEIGDCSPDSKRARRHHGDLPRR